MIARLHAVASLLSLTLVLGCAGAAPTRTQIVAREGGTATSASYQVVIPAMSLAADTEVTLSTAPAAGFPALANARPEVLVMEPEGTTLSVPAAVTIHADFVAAAATDTVSIHQLSMVDGTRWVPIESTRSSSGDVTVSVTQLAPLAVVVVPSAGAGGVHGLLHWGDGSVVAAAPVQLMQGTTLVASTTTDTAGAYAFDGLATGAYHVVVMYECNLDQPVTVTAGIAQLDLVLCGV